MLYVGSLSRDSCNYFFYIIIFGDLIQYGGLAQLARALALHARGHRFDSDILHIVSNERQKDL